MPTRMGGVEFTQLGCGIFLKKDFGAYADIRRSTFLSLKGKLEKD